MTLRIISAEKIEFEGTVDSVTLPGEAGLFQVLKGHAALIASLAAGKISYEAEGKAQSREISGGVADIKNDVVSVCLY